MAKTSDYLALDLGAESGRGLLGRFDGERLTLEEVHRFPNGPVRMLDTLHWDLPRLFDEIKTALRKVAATDRELDGVGVDTWGVDFGLIGRGETLLGNPVHYRDARTDGMLEAAFRRVPRERIYEITGLQFLPFNTLYQLLALRLSDSPLLEVAETLLMMPDLFGWLLTGRRVGERTNASTTQLLDPRTGTLVRRALRGPGPAPVDPPRAGRARDRAGSAAAGPGRGGGPDGPAPDRPGAGDARHGQRRGRGAGGAAGGGRGGRRASGLVLSQLGDVVAPGGRGPPAGDHRRDAPRTTSRTRGAWRGRRACSRTSWDSGWCRSAAGPGPGRGATTPTRSFSPAPRPPGRSPPWSIPTTRRSSPPATCPPGWRRIAPGPARSRPADEGAFVRCCLESLALKYRWTIERLEAILGTTIRTIHVVGGGTRNTLLCQFTADACGRPVHAGPVEATAAGNVLLQAMARGRIGSLADARAIVARSFPVTVYEPRDPAAWTDAAGRFAGLVGE